jgi:hypothetical protein
MYEVLGVFSWCIACTGIRTDRLEISFNYYAHLGAEK